MDVDTLRDAVERTYAAGPLADISWPDPHSDREVADEEYSRVTDPERYRVIGARTAAWCAAAAAGALSDLDGVPEILAVVGGGFVHVEAAGWSLQTTVDGWSANGLGPHPTSQVEDLIARARAGDSVGDRVLLGAAW